HGHAPFAQVTDKLDDSIRKIQKYDIQIVLHAESMYRTAWRNHETLTCLQRRTSEQAPGTCQCSICAPRMFNQQFLTAIYAADLHPAHRIPDARNFMAIGKPSIRNVSGKINTSKGKMSLTGASIACFSARWNRSVRRCSAWAFKALPSRAPIFSA